jgi:hypothetical protein
MKLARESMSRRAAKPEFERYEIRKSSLTKIRNPRSWAANSSGSGARCPQNTAAVGEPRRRNTQQ